MRHELQLWAFASRELELGEHRFVEAHLEDCPECVEQLAAVQVAREALELARVARPSVGWSRLDEKVGALVEKRLQAQARRPLYLRWGLPTLGLALAAAAVLWVLTPKEEPVPAPPEAPAAVTSWARVDRARGLTRLDGEPGELNDGTELRGGDVLRTSSSGRAFLHLPDGSHFRVGGASQVALTRSEADDVALTLERGSVAVRASHQQRKAFVVHTGGVTVSVVGTVFGVLNDAQAVEVSVSEGKVRVELPNAETLLVEPGQRVRFELRSQKLKKLKLTPSNERELGEVTAVADAASSVEQRAVVPSVGGTPSSPPLVPAQGSPRTLPRLSASEARARQVTAPPSAGLSPDELAPIPKLEPQTTVVVEAPEDVWPTVGGGEIIRGVPPRRDPPEAAEPAPAPTGVAPAIVSQPDEWQPAPKPPAEEWASLPATATAQPSKLAEAPARPAAKDLETIFLQRAEAAVTQGSCERFLLGLEDLAQDAQRSARSEQARVLRARCFDGQLRPRQAMNEYRKYVEEYPQGLFLPEARRALGD